VTFRYDATQGNGALAATATVYAHTGLITTQSVNNADWKKTQGLWATADTRVKMTALGGAQHSLRVPVNTFYGINTGDTVTRFAFVFRDVAGTAVGRRADGGDIYVPVYNDSLHTGFITPSSHHITAAVNGTLDLFCATSRASSMTLFANGNILAQVNSDTFSYTGFTFLNYGQYTFLLQAIAAGDTAYDTLTALVNPPVTILDAPVGTIDGINYTSDSSVILQLFAPYKRFTYLLGDFNNWSYDPSYMMKRSLDGLRWWIQVDHLTPGKEYIYQYEVDGTIRIADPYTEKTCEPSDANIPAIIYPNLLPYPIDKTTGIASVLQTAQAKYIWTDSAYHRPDKHNLVIYELLVRDFVSQHRYDQLRDSLDYLQRLGINAIELMPIMEFEGNESWGYNPNFFIAPDKYYGTKNKLKDLIAECHRRGMAVLLDIALNHAFGSSPMVRLYWNEDKLQPAANSPWFNEQPTHPFNVGYDFNHLSPYTKAFVNRVTKHWLKEYHADGYRFDLTKGFTQKYSGNDVGAWQQYDSSRIHILEAMVDTIWRQDSTAICVFEHLSDNPEQIELSNHGILLWGNLNTEYNQATMGYPTGWDLSWASYQARGWSQANLVSYMESHDEERLMVRNLLYGDSITGYNTKSLTTAIARMELAAALFFPIPGPKMLWMFGERGYDISINKNCRICTKPSLWSYMKIPARLHEFKVWSALIHLKTTYAPFATKTYDVDMAGTVKRIRLGHSDFNVISIGNFGLTGQTGTPSFHHTGMWYEYFTGDSLSVSSTGHTISLLAGEYRLYTDKWLPTPDLRVTTGIAVQATPLGDVTLYPNPNTGTVYLDVPADWSVEQWTLYDLSGRVVDTHRLTDRQWGVIELSLPEALTDGCYIYSIERQGITHQGKIMLMRGKQ
jgi:1,4-alpha-glucan branching enzyme